MAPKKQDGKASGAASATAPTETGTLTLISSIPPIARETGLTQAQVELVLRELVRQLSIAADTNQKIEFGVRSGACFTGAPSIRSARKGRNPATGEVIDIPEKSVYVIKAGGRIRDLHKKM